MRKLVFYHEIVGFIEEEKDKFPTVKSSIFFNSPPQLVVLAQEGQHKETIRSHIDSTEIPEFHRPCNTSIDNWKREHMLHFLEEKVKPTSAKI
ncbi:hypothetical protein CUMW_084370 [Citrus unshiu]|nr:hypothetical protein CUMW_084370 [Citrus unshiu]